MSVGEQSLDQGLLGNDTACEAMTNACLSKGCCHEHRPLLEKLIDYVNGVSILQLICLVIISVLRGNESRTSTLGMETYHSRPMNL